MLMKKILSALGLMKTVQLNVYFSFPQSIKWSINWGPDFAVTWGHEKDTCYKPIRKWLSISFSKAGSHKNLATLPWLYPLVALFCYQKTLAMFCLHSPTAPSLDLPHPKRNSIHVPKCEPQTLGSSSIPTVEHMRGASDEITLWYIHKPTEIDWNCMLSGRQKRKKKFIVTWKWFTRLLCTW